MTERSSSDRCRSSLTARSASSRRSRRSRRRNRRVATLGPGDFFGELALLLRRPRTATVTLTAPSRLLSISAHNFRPMLMTSPEIQFKLLEALAERLAPSTT